MATPTTQGSDAPTTGTSPGAATVAGAVHRVRIPLRISDFVGMHVNNVRFQEFSQDARLMWFREKFGVPGSRVPIALALVWEPVPPPTQTQACRLRRQRFPPVRMVFAPSCHLAYLLSRIAA